MYQCIRRHRILTHLENSVVDASVYWGEAWGSILAESYMGEV